MVHWGRFPAFRYVRNELKKPHLTMKDADRGAVFMRWKERFLVPDHRVQDISGASFAGEPLSCLFPHTPPIAYSRRSAVTLACIGAFGLMALFSGFYYVCVDFNPQPTAGSALDSPLSPTLEDLPESSLTPVQTIVPKPDMAPLAPRARRESVNRGSRRMTRTPSSSGTVHSNVATMSGFYFHQHSEPYVVFVCFLALRMVLMHVLLDISNSRSAMFPTTPAPASSSGRLRRHSARCKKTLGRARSLSVFHGCPPASIPLISFVLHWSHISQLCFGQNRTCRRVAPVAV